MQVVFVETLPGVAEKGEVKNVADGFARNFLFPEQKAVVATKAHIDRIRAKKEKNAEVRENANKELAKQLPSIEGITVSIPVKAEEDGTMYAAIDKKEVAKHLTKRLSLFVAPSAIDTKPLKGLGTYQASVHVGNVRASFTIELVKA